MQHKMRVGYYLALTESLSRRFHPKQRDSPSKKDCLFFHPLVRSIRQLGLSQYRCWEHLYCRLDRTVRLHFPEYLERANFGPVFALYFALQSELALVEEIKQTKR